MSFISDAALLCDPSLEVTTRGLLHCAETLAQQSTERGDLPVVTSSRAKRAFYAMLESVPVVWQEISVREKGVFAPNVARYGAANLFSHDDIFGDSLEEREWLKVHGPGLFAIGRTT